jgi:hypothetical protein
MWPHSSGVWRNDGFLLHKLIYKSTYILQKIQYGHSVSPNITYHVNNKGKERDC